jgi:HAMP domain-containing protein
MKFLVIFSALVAFCLSQSTSSLSDKSSDDVVTTKSSVRSDEVTTKAQEVTNTQKPKDETKVELNEKNDKDFINSYLRFTEDVAKLLGLMQNNTKIEQDLGECMTNLTSKANEIQQLETSNENLRQQIKAKDVEIESQAKSIGEYKIQLANSVEKAKKVQELSTEIIQDRTADRKSASI